MCSHKSLRGRCWDPEPPGLKLLLVSFTSFYFLRQPSSSSTTSSPRFMAFALANRRGKNGEPKQTKERGGGEKTTEAQRHRERKQACRIGTFSGVPIRLVQIR